MKNLLFPMVALASLACSCVIHERADVRQEIVSADLHEREFLFAPVRALAGRWEGQDADGKKLTVEFKLTAGGSAVREDMFPASENEMTNMYTLDGNRLRLTHYCAMGNQPHLIGNMSQMGRFDFETEVVNDLKKSDEPYMGSMTLVLVDADHIEEHWRALKSGKVDHETVFMLARVK